ncbi:MAG: type I restriction endonuclease subunit R [Symploca sp. SIO1C4]|uniref:Type I restriction enzyme endonuclease subunit n=1 Tax=Symploca sp. SIO1C4 TaxID=2607765 RepID=A0A6B3NFS2_9CYAN|nr:type I restriction endonuclease subunit R [Symploca sp. SIO1C4]
MAKLNEDTVEQITLEWLTQLNYTTLNSSEIAPDSSNSERQTFADIVLINRLHSALVTINLHIPLDAIADAIKKVIRTNTPNLFENNRRFHKLLTDGVDVEYQTENRTIYDKVWLIDFTNPDNNDWLAVNQFTVIENRNNRRPDIVIFINGLPLAVIELKNPLAEKATLKSAFNQLQTYKNEIPSLFTYNEILVISDNTEARGGTLTSSFEWFMPWRTIDGETIAPKGSAELEFLIKGIFDKHGFLDLIKNFIVLEVDGDKITKKMAGYHQFHAVNKAINNTVTATNPDGDRRIGVIWHTQGSGKSLTMAFYAGKIIQHPDMENPTLVILTDRNDLDEQLFNTFSACSDLLRQTPTQAANRANLQELLKVASGGVIFTTIQKFAPEQGIQYPQLSNRRNIVFIADEAHRSQYGLEARIKKDPNTKQAYISYGFAKHLRDALPNASFIGFTGTPIELGDKSTKAVFGDYIDIYDIQRAVEDEATVRIYYEARIAKLDLDESERPKIDPEFEEITEDEEQTTKEQLKSKWARLKALVGSEKRINQVANDIVSHFENRQASIQGKGIIVGMSRDICAELYNAIIKLRPNWHHEEDDKGIIKVVITGSVADEAILQPHIRSKKRRRELAKRFKKPDDQLKLVIVRDMWLTGFDAPSLHTMYIDKPMHGHSLMQAIARVNRVFKDKPGGLVVDYLGLADQLKLALQYYSQGDRNNTGIPTDIALGVLQEKYEIVKAMYGNFDYAKFFDGTPSERLSIIPAAINHILELENGKQRYLKAVTQLSKAFALTSSLDNAIAIRDEVGFFQVIKESITKHTTTGGKSPDHLNTAVCQIVSKAVGSEQVIDLFAAAGLKHPDISILSDEFLAEVRGLPYKNLALEILQKLINDQIKMRSPKNLVQSRSFAQMLENTIKQYHNRSLETAQAITELIELAQEIRQAQSRGENLGLTEDEIAFYDALEVNDSAVKVLGDETLRTIARELVQAIRRNVTIDWTVKESARAKLRTIVKRLLRKYCYPPDKQERATLTVLQQAQLLCKDWVA